MRWKRKKRKKRKKSAKVWQPREKAQTQTKKRERDAKKKGKKLARKLFFFFFLFFVEKRSNLSRGVSLSRVVTLKRVLIPSSTTTTRTIIPLLPERRFRRCPTRIKTILILIKTRSIAFARLRMPFRTTNGSRLAIYTPSFRSFPVALVGYDERCLFALQRWTRWWKQQQRQQQKRRR